LLCAKPIDGIRCEAAESMRAVDDANRTIVSCTRIEVQAQRDHVLENIGRRLHVRDAALIRPRSIAGYVGALSSGDCEVLVPNNFPVRVRRLVEEERPHRETTLAEDRDG